MPKKSTRALEFLSTVSIDIDQHHAQLVQYEKPMIPIRENNQK